MDNSMTWSFFQVWNESLLNRAERELKSRENIWAGELNGSYVDRYLKMTGVKPTNPPNARSLRKFEAGNMMEWVVGLVLKRAGILIPLPPLANGKPNNWLSYKYPELLEVTGKLDFLAGGKPDWEKARAEIKALELPEFFNRATDAIIYTFKQNFPDGMNEVVLEIKSCSSFMFDRYERTGRPLINHALQLFHYLKARDMREGHVVYICKDDLRMIEFGVFNPSLVEDVYISDIKKMTGFVNSKVQPDKELEVVFDEDIFKFQKNWKVEYSNYLEMLYGYKVPEAYRERWDGKVAQFNRTFARCVKGDKMTDLNKSTIEEAMAYFPKFYEYVELAKKKNIPVEELEK